MTLRFAYLGPEGTFTEAALLSLPESADAHRIPVSSVNAALGLVSGGEADAAMVPIENSVEGGVTATLDAIANAQGMRIVREVLVPVTFALAVRPGTAPKDIRTVTTHSHAWAQCRAWMERNLPTADYIPASSTAAGAVALTSPAASGAEPLDAAICSPQFARKLGLETVADNIGDNPHAVTRFILVSATWPLGQPTGGDKSTVVVPLPEDHPGALLEILTQFSSRGVNLTRIESRPRGDRLGKYFFSIDLEGHVRERRVADTLRGLHRISPGTKFLGSYPRADRRAPLFADHHGDDVFAEAEQWVEGLLGG